MTSDTTGRTLGQTLGNDGDAGAQQRLRDSEDVIARVAHLYYVLGETQQAIAQRLAMTRIKVHRLLAEARERGIVDIRIHARTSRTLALEDRLSQRFGLDLCRITPSDIGAARDISQVVGIYAAEAVTPLIAPDMTIAIAWGRTLRALAGAIPEEALPSVTVVPMLGSLSKRSTIDRYEAGTVLARRLAAECYYMPGPILADSPETRDAIMQQPLAREVIERARHADLALTSLGGTDMETLRAVGFIDDALFRQVREAGAIGNFLGHFLCEDASVLDHPVNDRVIAVHPRDFGTIRRRIMVSGGATKAPLMKSMLAASLLTGLVTDEATARLILGEDECHT